VQTERTCLATRPSRRKERKPETLFQGFAISLLISTRGRTVNHTSHVAAAASSSVEGAMPYSKLGRRYCEHPDGCNKWAASGGTKHCVSHGGGRRCLADDCPKSAVAGGSQHCVSHGGGRRCQKDDCTKGAEGSTEFCVAHGGGRRCTHAGCTKGADGGTRHCKAHGGGNTPQVAPCGVLAWEYSWTSIAEQCTVNAPPVIPSTIRCHKPSQPY